MFEIYPAPPSPQWGEGGGEGSKIGGGGSKFQIVKLKI